MLRTKLVFGVLLVVAIAVPGLAQNCDSSNAPESRTKAGERMPTFAVTEASGKSFSLEDQKGKVVLVNFWATWCGPCRQEMPRLEHEIWSKYGNSDRFAMIAIAREQTSNEVADFQEESGFTFPMAADPKRTTYKLFADAGIPRTYIVGASGKILYQTVGYCAADFDRMKQIVQRELGKR